jgi:hypothetical protein
MVRFFFGALGLVALTACPNATALNLGGGYTLAVGDSVAHGGVDIQATKFIDTATVSIATPLTSGSSSSGSSADLSCNVAFAQGQQKDGARALQVIVSCPTAR